MILKIIIIILLLLLLRASSYSTLQYTWPGLSSSPLHAPPWTTIPTTMPPPGFTFPRSSSRGAHARTNRFQVSLPPSPGPKTRSHGIKLLTNSKCRYTSVSPVRTIQDVDSRPPKRTIHKLGPWDGQRKAPCLKPHRPGRIQYKYSNKSPCIPCIPCIAIISIIARAAAPGEAAILLDRTRQNRTTDSMVTHHGDTFYLLLSTFPPPLGSWYTSTVQYGYFSCWGMPKGQ